MKYINLNLIKDNDQLDLIKSDDTSWLNQE